MNNDVMSYEEISQLGDCLCEYCKCTEYGLSMGIQHAIMGVTYGCEGMFCGEAYERYLEEF